MRKLQYYLTVVLALALILPATVFAQPPSIPLFVYGDVTIDGQPASLNTGILAEIDNIEVATAVVIIEGKYFIEIPDGKINVGKTILFKVNEIAVADEDYKVADVNTTPSVKFDLSIVTPVVIAPAPASLGGGGIMTTTTTTLPLSAAAQKVDANNDGIVDIFDFNTLMVNWGNTSVNNTADFSGDGKVDIFDFNLLMINWTL